MTIIISLAIDIRGTRIICSFDENIERKGLLNRTKGRNDQDNEQKKCDIGRLSALES